MKTHNMIEAQIFHEVNKEGQNGKSSLNDLLCKLFQYCEICLFYIDFFLSFVADSQKRHIQWGKKT